MDLSVVLTSAAVGAVVSSLLTLVGQLLERRGRQRELLMKSAVDLTIKHMERGTNLALALNKIPDILPLGMLVYSFHEQLTSVAKHGTLPPDVQKAYDDWQKGADGESS
jgi:hypothetical protein